MSEAKAEALGLAIQFFGTIPDHFKIKAIEVYERIGPKDRAEPHPYSAEDAIKTANLFLDYIKTE